jgi:antirestriction protein ArdC
MATFRQAPTAGNVCKGERGTTIRYVDRFIPRDQRRRASETGEGPPPFCA